MYKNLFYIFIIILSGLLFSCNYDGPENASKISESVERINLNLKQLDTIVLNPGNYMIGKFREGLRVDKTGKILSFADDMYQQIFMFNRDGDIISIIGREGSGPEEFLKISGYYVYNDQVIIVDESLLMVKIFDLNGTFINSFRLFDQHNLFINSRDIYVDGDLLYLQIIESGKVYEKYNSKLIARIELPSESLKDLIGEIDPFIEEVKHYLTLSNFTIDQDNNRLISILSTSPHIQIFDINNDLRTHYFENRSNFWNSIEERIDPSMPRHEIMSTAVGNSYSTGIFATKELILHHFQNLTDAWMKTSDYLEKENYLSVYNNSGTDFYGTIELPGILGDVQNEQLYIIEDFNPEEFKIGIYEIQMD